MLRSDYQEFSRLAREATLVPVVKSVMADLLTPVSAFLAIANGEKNAFLLESVERGEQIGRYTFLGARPYMQLHARGDQLAIERAQGKNKREVRRGNLFQTAKELLQQHRPAVVPALPPFTAGAVGFCSYDIVRQLENIGDHTKDDLHLPDCRLMFFDRLLAFDHLRHQIHIIAAADVSNQSPRRAYDRAIRDISAIEKKLSAGLSARIWQKAGKANGRLRVRAMTDRRAFEQSVHKAKEYIAAGDIFQVVLSQRLDFEPGVEPFNVYRSLRAVNPSPYMYFLSTTTVAVPALLTGQYPKRNIRASHEFIHGDSSVSVAVPCARCRQRRPELVCPNVAAGIAAPRAPLIDSEYGSVKVKELMYVERYSHVMHIVSALEGKLRAELHALDAFAACFPAGTLSGAPKVRAMQIIEELEPTRRGVYGGSVLYADFAGNLDSCIAIRTMVMQGKKAYLQAGAGIVADSDPASEYQESLNKAQAVIRAVEAARNGNA